MKKEDYLRGLQEAGVLDEGNAPAPAKPAAPPAEGATPPTGEAAPPAEPPAQPAGEGAPAPNAAAAPAAGAPGEPAPAVAPAGPVHGEPFPGWSLLPEETRNALKERFDAAEAKLRERDEALHRRNQEFNQLHSRLAPTQQQLEQIRAEREALQKKLQDNEQKTRATAKPQVMQRIAELRQNYPDDAALFDAMFSEAEAARAASEEATKRLTEIEQRAVRSEQLAILTGLHPTWQQDLQSESFGNWYKTLHPREQALVADLSKSIDARDADYVLTRYKSDTTFQDPAFAVWFGALEPAAQQEVTTLRRSNPMQVIRQYEQDWAQARAWAAQQSANPAATAPPANPTPAHAARATPTPVPDPDPSRRATAPALPAGQPMSDKKRAFIEAAEFWESQRKRG